MAPSGDSHARSSAAFVSSIKSSAKRLTSTISPVKETTPVYSLTDTEYSYQPSFSTDRSSTSSRSSNRTAYRSKPVSGSTASLPYIQDRPNKSAITPQYEQTSPISVPKRKPLPSPQHFTEAPLARAFTSSGPLAHIGTKHNMAGSGTMTVTPFAPSFRSGSDQSKPPSTAQSNVSFGQAGNAAHVPPPTLPSVQGSFSPATVYQHIQDTSSKRISTLEYLRKSHEGRMYWYNTLLFSRPDLAKLPYFEPKKLARRATNYLLLGLSLPTILDLNASNITDYLRALNALLVEFESYQQFHPAEGSSASSLSRARIPQMFKRATQSAGAKGRRASSAQEIGLPMNSSDPTDLKSMVNGGASTGPSTTSSFPISEQELLPGEEYTHLLTPFLPFDPDYFETFATLCDVLTDCYARIISLVPSPAQCVPGISEIFTKADSKLRKIIVSGLVKEFEEASRNGAKAEIAGVGKVVLGGLM
ncbi:MAG: hypothetical protein Q9191_007651 [Dirinaria sp. TL-2023a]